MRKTLRKKQKRFRKTRRTNKGGGNNNNNNYWNKELERQQKFEEMLNLNSNFSEYLPSSKNKSMVNQGKFKIIGEKNGPLKTSGLATCSGLAMKIGTKRFLAHLDAVTKIKPIIEAIQKEIDSEGIRPKYIIIYAGGGFANSTSEYTVKMAYDICKQLGIPENEIYVIDKCFWDEVYV
jgi:hypothetical protein